MFPFLVHLLKTSPKKWRADLKREGNCLSWDNLADFSRMNQGTGILMLV